MNERFSVRVLFVCLILVLTTAASQAEGILQVDDDPVFSIVLQGGQVYDGSGGDPVMADVGIKGDRIAAIGDLSSARAGRRIDVKGLAVVPGFIDIHSHGDQFLVIHDRWLDRTTNGKGLLQTYNLEEIKQFDAGNGEVVPTLWQLLA